MSIFEEKGLGLFKLSEPDPRDYRLTYGVEALPTVHMIPKPTIHDQGKFQNCAAHALSVFFESRQGGKIAYNWFYGNRRHSEHKGEGLISRDMLKSAQKDGALVWGDFPFEEEVPKAVERFETHFPNLGGKAKTLRIGNYYSLATVEDVKRALLKGYVVLFGTMLFESFGKISKISSLMPIPKPEKEDMVGGHMMTLRGYDDKRKAFRGVNSWGDAWADGGEFWVPYDLVQWSEENNFPIPLFEGWAIDSIVTAPVTPEQSGWYKQDGKWRYQSGGMDKTGWIQDKEKWYFLGKDGFMVTGWLEDKYKWYYLNPAGDMRVNAWVKSGKWWYYFGKDGAMLTGYQTIGGKLYFLNDDTSIKEVPLGACPITDKDGAVIL